MSTGYEINEKDIDSVLRYLKLTDPTNATPENAIDLLELMQATVHKISHEDPELLQQLWAQLKKNKNLS